MAHLPSNRYLTSSTLSSSKLIKPPFLTEGVIVLKAQKYFKLKKKFRIEVVLGIVQ